MGGRAYPDVPNGTGTGKQIAVWLVDGLGSVAKQAFEVVPTRLGMDGLIERLQAVGCGALGWEAGLEATLSWAEDENGGHLADDVALMLLA